jgi:hypothetical protein
MSPGAQMDLIGELIYLLAKKRIPMTSEREVYTV